MGKYISDIEPQASFIIDPRGIAFDGVTFPIKAGVAATIIIFPFLFQNLPMKITPTRNTEFEAVISLATVGERALLLSGYIDTGKSIIFGAKNYEFFIDDFLSDMIFECNKVRSLWTRKLRANESNRFLLSVTPTA